MPKHLLSAATTGSITDYGHLLRDNYETPLYAPQIAGSEVELQQLEMILKLSVDDFTSTHERCPAQTSFRFYRKAIDAGRSAKSPLDHDARY